jgi:hypothetical protein
LVTSDPIDEKSENREIFPGVDGSPECFQVTLLVWPAQYERHIDAEISGYPRNFAVMV